jgi:hypothetical protein
VSNITVTCPHCGSDNLYEVSTVERVMQVTGWRQNDAGQLESEEYGDDEVLWGTDTPDGTFVCRGCNRVDIPLAELVVS